MPKSSKTLLSKIGLRIDQEMKAGEITAARLAEKLGISRQAVDNYRNGVSEPPIEKLIQLADLFGVSLDWLMCREGAVRSTNADIASICRNTGLSEKAVEKLKKICFSNFSTGKMDSCNSLVEHKGFDYLLTLINAYTYCEDGPIMPMGNNLVIENAIIDVSRYAVIKSEIMSLMMEIINDIEKTVDKHSESTKELIWSRTLGRYALRLFEEGKLTIEQLQQTIAEYKKGNFDYSPLAQKEGDPHGEHPKTDE